MVFFFFFFKQKTAYEMRISDWSSDVCSSDLVGAGPAQGNRSIFMAHPRLDQPTGVVHILNTCKRQSAGRVAYRPGRQKITDPGELNVRREPTSCSIQLQR